MKNFRTVFWIVYIILGVGIGVAYLKSDFNPLDSEDEFDMFSALVVYSQVHENQRIACKVRVVKEFRAYTLITDSHEQKFSVFSFEFRKHLHDESRSLFDLVEINDSIARAPYCDTLYLYKRNGEKLRFKIKYR